MASQWGSNTVGPGGNSIQWCLTRPNTPNVLPVLSFVPLSPSFTSLNESFIYKIDSGPVMSFPVIGEVGMSTTWIKLSDDSRTFYYFLSAYNFSSQIVEFAFLEANL